MAGLRGLLAGLAGAVLLAAGSATATQSAQQPPAKDTAPADLSGVIVTAPDKPSPLVDPTTQFVRARVPQDRAGQLSRFRDKICVNVVGLPPAYGAFVAKSVIKLANEVRAPVDHAAKCAPNVNIIFSSTPQAQLDDIARRRDILFGFHFAADLKKLTTFDRPIQSWYLTRSVGTDGTSVLELNHGANFRDAGPGAAPESLGATVNGRAGSRLGEDLSSELVHALILVDANKVADTKIGAIGDYIALLALSRWQGLEHCNAVPTILNLMADGCAGGAPQSLTSSDVALLKELYSLDPRELGTLQRMAIAERMRSEMKQGAAETPR